MNDKRSYQSLVYELVRGLNDSVTATDGLVDVLLARNKKTNSQDALALLKLAIKKQKNLLTALECIKSCAATELKIQNLRPEIVIKRLNQSIEKPLKFNRTYRCSNILTDLVRLSDSMMLLNLVYDFIEVLVYTKSNYVYFKIGYKKPLNKNPLMVQDSLILKTAEAIASSAGIIIKFNDQSLLLRVDRAMQLDLSLGEKSIAK